MSANKVSVERHEAEVIMLQDLNLEERTQYWQEFYSSSAFQFLEDPAEIGRFGVIAEIILSCFDRPSILDIGCGVGHLCGMINLDIVKSYKGSDISNNAIEKAQQNYPQYSFFCESIENLTVNSPQDIVVISEFLFYTDYLVILEKAFSFLAPAGLLIISLFDSPSGNIILQYLKEHAKVKKHIEIISHDSGLSWHVVALSRKDEGT